MDEALRTGGRDRRTVRFYGGSPSADSGMAIRRQTMPDNVKRYSPNKRLLAEKRQTDGTVSALGIRPG